MRPEAVDAHEPASGFVGARVASGRRRIVTALSVLSWIAVAGSTAWLAVLWLPPLDFPLFIAAQAAPFVPLVVAAPAVTFGIIARRWAVAMTAALVLCTSALTALPHLGFHDPRDVHGAPTIVVTSSNLLVHNPDLRAAAGELMASDADIVVVQEVDSAGLKILDSVLRDDAYPFRAADPHPGFHGGVIYSRWPLLGWRTLDIAGSPMLEAEVLTPTGAITVVNVHTVAPLTPRLAAQWRRQFDALEVLAADVETPLLLIGDFNATTSHEPFRRLTSTELRDAFLDVGSGLGSTFPSNHPLLPPFMRIDHAVGSSSLQFHNIDDWRVDGSDHRAITISVSLSRQELQP